MAFTLLCLASPESFNAGMAMYAIEGTDDAGMVESGATEISGVKIVDDKTLTVTTKWPIALYTFENNYGRYVLTLPEHIPVSDTHLDVYKRQSYPRSTFSASVTGWISVEKLSALAEMASMHRRTSNRREQENLRIMNKAPFRSDKFILIREWEKVKAGKSIRCFLTVFYAFAP